MAIAGELAIALGKFKIHCDNSDNIKEIIAKSVLCALCTAFNH
jgi:hypothetical protein